MGKKHKIIYTNGIPETIVFFVLTALVIGVMIAQIFNQNYNDVMLCALTLILLLIPTFVERQLHIHLPSTLEVIILLFIFAAEILGEIREYYINIAYWDTMLHTLNGFIMAAIGFAMVDILNQNPKVRFDLSPKFVVFVAFCFSMTVGVLWEFFEFGMDYFLKTDMQKDTFIQSISSVLLNPDGTNNTVKFHIDSVVVNGETWPGYVDIGLIDTMKDLMVNCIGAIVFSVIGGIYISHRGKGTIAKSFIPTLKTKEQIEAENEADKNRFAHFKSADKKK